MCCRNPPPGFSRCTSAPTRSGLQFPAKTHTFSMNAGYIEWCGKKMYSQGITKFNGRVNDPAWTNVRVIIFHSLHKNDIGRNSHFLPHLFWKYELGTTMMFTLKTPPFSSLNCLFVVLISTMFYILLILIPFSVRQFPFFAFSWKLTPANFMQNNSLLNKK